MALRKKTYVDFRAYNPVISIGQKTGSALGTTNEVVTMQVGAVPFELRYDSTSTTITGQRLVDTNCCNGLEVPLDNDDGDAIEITQGILADENAPYAFKIGTDPGFELSVKLGIPDVSDAIVFVGFRIAAAYVDAIGDVTPATCLASVKTAYTDKAGFVMDEGDLLICTSNDNSDVTTDIAAAWADDAVKTLTVKVDSAGAVTYFIDGSAVADAVAFSFDSTDIVVPCIIICRVATGSTTPPIVQTYRCGYSE